ncbi:MAG TPA: TauD/TfdA family dioxygenase, partial [Puia sp.]|nr:TauD/TfdA family dioxygenase [Puia sp.]
AIEDRLQTEGAIKFRGVHIDSTETFQRIVDAISNKFLRYIDGNSPRTRLSDHVYTSTEYDQTQRITMHNELSYSAKWPNKLFFTCLQPAVTGGETLLADSREILQRMDPDIVREVEQRGITYIRNLHGNTGMGPSWQDTFETKDKRQAEDYCKSYGMQFEWGERDSLRLIQPSRGILRHRATGEKVWFNQIDQFHPSHLGEEMYEVIQLMYGEPENFPMYVRFGDGTAISASLVGEVLKTIDEVTAAPVWERDEFLLIDNELVSHGRNPFSGQRKVLVAMSE